MAADALGDQSPQVALTEHDVDTATDGRTRSAVGDHPPPTAHGAPSARARCAGLGKLREAERCARELLTLEERPGSSVHHAQRCQVRRCQLELRTKMPPKCRRHGADTVEQSAAHLQEAHLQREPELELWSASFIDDPPLSLEKCKERLDVRTQSDCAADGVAPRTSRASPSSLALQRGHDSRLRSANSNTLFLRRKAGASAANARNPNATFGTESKGTP